MYSLTLLSTLFDKPEIALRKYWKEKETHFLFLNTYYVPDTMQALLTVVCNFSPMGWVFLHPALDPGVLTHGLYLHLGGGFVLVGC